MTEEQRKAAEDSVRSYLHSFDPAKRADIADRLLGSIHSSEDDKPADQTPMEDAFVEDEKKDGDEPVEDEFE